jgi:competence protein ComEA
MSIYRSLVTVVAALGLATSVFAADESTTATQNPAADNTTHAMQTADATSTTTTTTTTTDSKVDVNKATAKDLMKVKGMSSGKAKSIVAYRKKHGEFKSLDELKDVKGFKRMNEDSMKHIQDQLTM